MLVLLLWMLAAPPGAELTTPAEAGELRATFVGNMAVHITDGRVAILTDFPYKSGAFGYMEWSKSVVPAGPAPLCLITHSHDDHFAPSLAREFCGSILGPKDVVQASGVRGIEMKDEVRWEGLSLRPLATPHAGLEHYSYVVEWGGVRLYFTGDTESTDALLGARDLDAAFVSPWLLRSVHGKKRRIDAAQVVVYHHQAGEAVPEIQGRVLPKPGSVLGVARSRRASE